MFLDASAIVAIIVRESDADALGLKMTAADRVYTSAIAIYEAALGSPVCSTSASAAPKN